MKDAAAAAQQQLTLELRDDKVFVMTLTGRPHKANVFTTALVARLAQLLTTVEEHVTQQPCSLVLLGAGKFFSAGFDLATITSECGPSLVVQTWQVLARLLVLPVPTVCLFTGHAFGLGLFLGLACDHRLMVTDDKDAGDGRLCLPEIHIGLPLGAGFAALAKCKLGPGALKVAALTGKRWTATEARHSGMVDAVVPASSALAAAMALAKGLVPTSAKGNLGAIKRELYGDAHAVLLNAPRSKL
jgi:enoyl-CoA hydratase/carnithine racemase